MMFEAFKSLSNSAAAAHRSLVVAAGLLTFVISATANAQNEPAAEETTADLPRLADMVLPSFEQLMKDDPYDWVVLRDGSVLVTEPVWPRPDPLTSLVKEKADLEAKARKTQEERQRLTDLRSIKIVLLEDQSTDYNLPFAQVEQIISFPMLMLRRIDKLLEDGDIRKAYELLMEVDRIAPGWDVAGPRFEQLMVTEAKQRFSDGNVTATLALLDELAQRNINHPELARFMSSIVQQQTQNAVDKGDYDRARYFIGRLAKHFPDHPVVVGWKNRLQNQMLQMITQAQQLASAGQHAAAAETALKAGDVWQPTGNVRAAYKQYVSRYQTLRVAVDGFARDNVISPIPLEPELRHRELTVVPLFEPTAADELTYFRSSYFDVWDPQDLGREVVFSIRQTRPYWQSQPILTANQIADTLGDMLDPRLATFNPRLASFVKEFSVRSPSELQISFHRVPLNLEALFRFPVRGFPEGERPSTPDAERQDLSTRFVLAEQSEGHRVYRRSVPEPDGLLPQQYHVAEIHELQFPDRHSVIQAFNRDEVDLIPHLHPWEVDIFKGLPDRYAVQQYAIPQTHLLVFNPLSESVTNPQLRRALSFGVDRENLLKIVLLRDEEMKYGRPVSAPWHSGSYANNPLVKTPEYDHYLSYLLRLAALEQLRIPEKQKFVADAKAKAQAAKEDWDEEIFRKDNAEAINAAGSHIQLPRLKMLCDPDEVVMLAAEQMVKRWQALGFEIELTPADQAGDKIADTDWDFMYRRVRMHEPLLDLWSLLLTDDKFDVSRLASYPDWMRQELINLDYSTSFIDAQQKLFTIHRHMSAQAFIVPLWEIDDFMLFRREAIKGFEGRPLSLYHGVERWMVVP